LSTERTSEATLRRLFEACCVADANERARLLEEARRVDPEAAAEAAAMLRHHDAGDAMLDRPPAAVSGGASGRLSAGGGADGAPTGALAAGTRVGKYTVCSLLGYGGMGVVYEADQDSPRRRVALKLVRSELVTGSLLRRFEHEAAALGLLQHPGIAQVYEAGSASVAGVERPFIAMELVRGEVITAYVRRVELDVRKAAELVARIADAVDHAHRRGVIHRDLKPANIVVTAEGVPKVLDFGVARLASATGEQAGATMAGQVIGTLGYLAPEQALGDPARVDARCDVYALGVVAYELLAGRHPAPQAGSSLRETVNALERSAIRPPGEFAPAVRGDLETIVMHALEADPSRRYQHAADLAAELRRYLADQPILARPPSTVYQLRKFASRNRLAFTAAAAVVIALACGVVGLGVGMVRARAQAERAERVNLYMRAMLSLDAQLLVGRDRSLLKAMLDQAIEKLGSLKDDPAAQDAIRAVVGNAYAEFGYPTEAVRILPEVVSRQRARHGPRHRDSMFATDSLAHAMLISGDHAGALPLLEELYETRRKVDGEDAKATQTTLNNLILVLRSTGQHERAMVFARSLHQRRVETLGTYHLDTLHAEMVIGGILVAQGKFEEAEVSLRAARDAFIAIAGPRDPQTVKVGISWCDFLRRAGRPEEYITDASELWPIALDVMGENYNPALALMQQVSLVLVDHGRRSEALPVLERVLAIQPRLYPDHPNTLALLANSAQFYADDKVPVRALELCEQAITLCRRIRPGDHAMVANLLRRKGLYLLEMGDASASRESLLEAHGLLAAAEPRDEEQIASIRESLASACDAMGRPEEAAQWREASSE